MDEEENKRLYKENLMELYNLTGVDTDVCQRVIFEEVDPYGLMSEYEYFKLAEEFSREMIEMYRANLQETLANKQFLESQIYG